MPALQFPGCRCPGLIEATRIDNRARPRPGCFRGGAAPASLKQVIALRVHQGVDLGFRGVIAPASLKLVDKGLVFAAQHRRFPGPHCPGLIEAACSRQPRANKRSSDFRGVTAPATLKRRGHEGRESTSVLFPRRQSPGPCFLASGHMEAALLGGVAPMHGVVGIAVIMTRYRGSHKSRGGKLTAWP